jgi:hypothetical protein
MNDDGAVLNLASELAANLTPPRGWHFADLTFSSSRTMPQRKNYEQVNVEPIENRNQREPSTTERRGRHCVRERVCLLCIVISCRGVVMSSKGIQNRRVLKRVVLVVVKSGSLCGVVLVILGILQAWVNGQVVIHGRVFLR